MFLTKICNKCQIEKSLTDYYFFKTGRKKGKPRYVCKKCDGIQNNEYHKTKKEKISKRKKERLESQREYFLFYSARSRSKERGLEFNIELSDIIIPEYCPLLEIQLDRKSGSKGKQNPNAPSLDRIDSSKGYIKGNVWVISWRANQLKNNAILEEMKLLVKNWETINNKN